MAYSASARELYQRELASIREAGLFKEERYIHAPQAADIEVEVGVPALAMMKLVIPLVTLSGNAAS